MLAGNAMQRLVLQVTAQYNVKLLTTAPMVNGGLLTYRIAEKFGGH